MDVAGLKVIQLIATMNQVGFKAILLRRSSTQKDSYGFLMARGTPSHHPFIDGFSLTKTNSFWGVSPWPWKPPYKEEVIQCKSPLYTVHGSACTCHQLSNGDCNHRSTGHFGMESSPNGITRNSVCHYLFS